MMTELISPPEFIRETLARFRSYEFADLLTCATSQPGVASELSDLDDQLAALISSCTQASTVAQSSAILDGWDRWCERFEEIECPELEQELLDTFIALPQ